MSLVTSNRPLCYPQPRSGDLIDKKFHNILNLIEEGKLKQVEQMLNSERSLLYEKGSIQSDWPSQKLFVIVCTEAFDDTSGLCRGNNDCTLAENLLKIAVKILEIDARGLNKKEKDNVISTILFCKPCEPRSKLIPYLCLCGAETSHSKEFEENQKKIQTVFLNGLLVLITKFEKNNILNLIPKELKFRIVKEGMELSCPYLFNFPPEILNIKMRECLKKPVSLSSRVWNYFFG